MLFYEKKRSMVQESPMQRMSGKARHFPLRYLTQHCIKDGPVVCSLLRNAKTIAALCHPAQKEVAQEWAAVIL
jgi:hypothetical protein